MSRKAENGVRFSVWAMLPLNHGYAMGCQLATGATRDAITRWNTRKYTKKTTSTAGCMRKGSKKIVITGPVH